VASLACRSCRESVSPGDLICANCRANLTGPDAVIDTAQLPAAPAGAEPRQPEEPEEPEEPGQPGQPEEPDAPDSRATASCPYCDAELPTANEPICPMCMRPLGGGVVLRLEPGHGGGSWQHLIVPGASLVLGRDPRQSPAAAVLGPYDTVSRRHARVSIDVARRATVADLGSTNGTFVDDVQVPAGTDADLRPGCRLRLGSSVSLLVEPA
jgi:hypothetical protein